MLSRVADSLYWMIRYLERAENIARFIEVSWQLALDESQEETRQWRALIDVSGDNDAFLERYPDYAKQHVMSFLLFDEENTSSILSCLRAARENARHVREIISMELWEQINDFYHLVEGKARRRKWVYENPGVFCEAVRLKGMLLHGINTDTMVHAEGWHFCRLGRFLERADKTSRILDVKYFTLLPHLCYIGTAYDDNQWAALLRATGALNAYRQLRGRVYPSTVADFLIFDRTFPRSIRFCLLSAQASLHAISGAPVGGFSNRAERRMGHLCSHLAYADIEGVFEKGLHEFIDHLQIEMNAIDRAVAESFFHYPVQDAANGAFQTAANS